MLKFPRAVLLLFLAGLAVPVPAADFAFSVIIRAGLANPGDYELGIGPTGVPSAGTIQTAHMVPYYGNNTPQRFEIGYQEATSTAFVRVYHANGTYAQATYVPPDAIPMPANSSWALPGSALYVRASRRPVATGIRVNDLALGPGLDSLDPLSTTSLEAVRPAFGDGVTQDMGSPVVFRAFQNGGDWLLSGTIAMQGLRAYVPGGAARSELHLSLTAEATAVPEPTYWPVFPVLATVIGGRAIWRRRKPEGRER